MTEVLDLATLFQINAWIYLLMSLATWWVLGRPVQWSARVWCLAGVMAGISVWLISLRGVIDDVWTYLVAQPMLLASYLLYAQALRLDRGRGWSWRWLLGWLILYAWAIAFWLDEPKSWGLAMLVRSANSVALMLLTIAAVALARHERSRNAYFIVAGFSLFTTSMLLNAWMTWHGQSVLYDLQQGVLNHVMGVVSVLTLVMIYIGYLGMALERAQQINSQLRQAQWRTRLWREQAQALILLDRQRTLTVLANSLGHGIVQPLTATRLNVELVGWMTQSGADLKEVGLLLQQVIDGLQRSAALIERIRGFLRPASSLTSTVHLQSVMQDAQDLLREELMYRGIDMHLQMPAQPVRVHAESLALTQALVQVIRNAMDALQNQSERRITLDLSIQGQEAWVRVVDSGPGFPAHMRIQAPVGAQISADWQGGVGLYITQGISSQFQGRLLLDNLSSGGASVTLILPLIEADQS